MEVNCQLQALAPLTPMKAFSNKWTRSTTVTMYINIPYGPYSCIRLLIQVFTIIRELLYCSLGPFPVSHSF
jgi:hypothetical protein